MPTEIEKVYLRAARKPKKSIAPQAPHTSMEEHDYNNQYNDAGTVISRIGAQEDGGHGTAVFDSPAPDVPSAPILTGAAGAFDAYWDGGYADLQARKKTYHAFTDMLVSVDPAMAGATRGGSFVTVGSVTYTTWAAGTYYVAYVSESTAGRRSAISEIVSVVVEDTVTQANLDAADQRLVDARAELEAADAALTAALAGSDADIAAAQVRLDTAEADIVTAFGEIDTVGATATQAAQDASGAQSAADTAQAKADIAMARSANAVQDPSFENPSLWSLPTGLAITTAQPRTGTQSLQVDPGAGVRFVHLPIVPVVEGQSWRIGGWNKNTADYGGAGANAKIRIGDQTNANKGGVIWVPSETWTHIGVTFTIPAGMTGMIIRVSADHTTGTLWVDDLEVRNVTDAKEALDAAATAQDRADAAHELAGTAESNAQLAITSANGKNAIHRDTTAPAGNGVTDGDTWIQFADTTWAKVIGQWTWGGASWDKNTLSHEVISSVDVGALTVIGQSTLADVVAQQIAADSGKFMSIDVDQLNVTGTGTFSTAVMDEAFAEMFSTRVLTAGNVLIGNPADFAPSLLETPDQWELTGGIEIVASSITEEGYRFQWAAPGTTGWAYGPWRKVSPGEKLYAEATSYKSADFTGGAYLRYYWYDKDKLPLNPDYTGAPQSSAAPTGTRYVIDEAVVPAGTAYTRFVLALNNSTTGNAGFLDAFGKSKTDGTLVALNSVTAPHIVASEELTGKIVRGDMFVGKSFEGGTFTGTTYQTDAAADRGVKIDSTGITTWSPAGTVTFRVDAATGKVTITGTDPSGATVLISDQGIQTLAADGSLATQLGTFGDSLLSVGESASINPLGEANFAGLSSADDPLIMGRPLLGDYGQWQSPSYDAGSWIDDLPRGVLTSGVVPTQGTQVTDGEMGLFQVNFDAIKGRNYSISLEPLAAYVEALAGGDPYGQLRLRREYGVSPANPKYSDPIWKNQVVRNATSGRILFSFGGTWLHQSNVTGPVKVLFSMWTAGRINTFAAANGGESRFKVEDIGHNVPDNAISRVGYRKYNPDPEPQPPTTDPKKDYTWSRLAGGTRSYKNSGGSEYIFDSSKLFQGNSPYVNAGNTRSIVIFPSPAGDLSGSEIKNVEIFVYFDHWHFGSGGTANIGLHGHSTLPGTLNTVRVDVSVSFNRNQGRWIQIPSALWPGFKNGTWRGFTLTGNSAEEYGYADAFGDLQPELRIEYRK